MPLETESTTDESTPPKPNGADEPASMADAMQAAIDESRAQASPPANGADPSAGEDPPNFHTPPESDTAEEIPAAATEGDGTEETPAETAEPAAPTTDENADSETVPAAAKGEPEPIDDEALLSSLSERAQGRFRELLDETHTLGEELTDLRDQYNGVAQMIADSGTDAQGFAEMLEYSRRVSTGDYQGALEILDGHRRAIALQIGPDQAGVDLVAGHPDLLQQLQEMTITPETAQQLALARAQAADAERRAQIAARNQQVNQQASIAEQNTQQVADAVAQIEANWSRTDPHYQRKAAIVNERLADIVANFPADQWAARVQYEYEQAGNLISQVSAGQRRKTMPISGTTNTRTPPPPEPKTFGDAITQHIQGMRETA